VDGVNGKPDLGSYVTPTANRPSRGFFLRLPAVPVLIIEEVIVQHIGHAGYDLFRPGHGLKLSLYAKVGVRVCKRPIKGGRVGLGREVRDRCVGLLVVVSGLLVYSTSGPRPDPSTRRRAESSSHD